MKITALLVLKCSADSSSSSSGEAADPVVLANAFDVSNFGDFQLGAAMEFIFFVARTVAKCTPAGQRQSVQLEDFKVHSYNGNGLCALGFMDDHYAVRRAFSLLNKVLEEYQKAFGESWRTIQTDSSQPWPYLNEALTDFQEDLTTKVDSMMARRLVNDRFRALVYLAEHHITPYFLQRQIGFFLYENATSIQHIHILAVLRHTPWITMQFSGAVVQFVIVACGWVLRD